MPCGIIEMQISRITARGRAGLHLWTSCGNSYLELPHDICTEDVSVSTGVKSLTVFSPHSAKLWNTALHYSASPHWKVLSLPMEERDNARQVSSGLSHFLVCSDAGRVYSGGCGYFGQTGRSVSTDWSPLSKVKGLEDSLVKQVACGLDHSHFLLDNGQVFACGWSADGQTGIGSYESSSQLTQVNLGSNKVVFLATCSDSCFAVTDRGEVFGWGNNEYQQLGMVSEEPQLNVPRAMDCSEMDGMVTSIAAGGAFTAFLTSEGSVYLVGYGIENFDVAARTKGHVAVMQLGCLVRQVHCGQVAGKVVKLEAGLNYLLALTSPRTGMIWGKLELLHHPKLMHCHADFMVCPEVVHLACGPVGLAAITTSSSKVLEFVN